MNEENEKKLNDHLKKMFEQLISLQEIKNPSISEQYELAFTETELVKLLREEDGEREL